MNPPEPFQYSEKYNDDEYEYRHVIIPLAWFIRMFPRGRLLSEKECVEYGIQQSRGWVHFMIYKPEPNVLLFRRRLDFQQVPLLPQQSKTETK